MTSYNRNNAGAAALAFARQMTGKPYIFGGTWPSSGGTDCSGMVQWAYEQVGVKLPRDTYDQYKDEPLAANVPSEPGDLLFIPGSDAIGIMPGHVMMFVAPGLVFQAEETGTKIGQFVYNTSSFEYRTRPALLLPPPPAAKPLPAANKKPAPAADMRVAGLVLLKNEADAVKALKEGFALWYWGVDGHFHPQVGSKPDGVSLYADAKYALKK